MNERGSDCDFIRRAMICSVNEVLHRLVHTGRASDERGRSNFVRKKRTDVQIRTAPFHAV
jgi:hypothetical protein